MSDTTAEHRLSAIRWEHPDGSLCRHRHTTRGVALEEGCPGRRAVVRCSCGWTQTSAWKATLESEKRSHQLRHR
jgi:hypothetical protein